MLREKIKQDHIKCSIKTREGRKDWKTKTKAKTKRDFPGGPVIKNPPFSDRDVVLISGWGTKIPRAVGQLSPHVTTTELARLNKRAPEPQTTEPTCFGARTTTRERKPAHFNQREARVLQRRPNAAKKINEINIFLKNQKTKKKEKRTR